MTDRQSGWNSALNLVDDVFTEVAWQPGLQSYRREAALALTKVPETMMDTVGPFRKRLEGEPCPEPPFDSALSEDSPSDMDTAISILVDTFPATGRGAKSLTFSRRPSSRRPQIWFVHRLLSQNHAA